jgi:hypothetical protein
VTLRVRWEHRSDRGRRGRSAPREPAGRLRRTRPGRPGDANDAAREVVWADRMIDPRHGRTGALAVGLDTMALAFRIVIAQEPNELRAVVPEVEAGRNAHPIAIRERLGHSSITVTMDTYGGLFPRLDEAIATGLEEPLRAALAALPRPEGPPEGLSLQVSAR